MTHRIFRSRWPLLLLLLSVHPRCLSAEESVGAESETGVAVAHGDDASSMNGSSLSDTRRRHAVGFLGMMVLAGVIVIMLVLIGVTMAWGRGLRKSVRTPDRPAQPLDELWYLRKRGSRSDDVQGEELTDNGS